MKKNTINELSAQLNYNKSFIGRSTNNNHRYYGCSGGVATEIIKHLFDENIIYSSISYVFTNPNLYQPKIIYSFKDYNQSSSIYHEIKIIRFIKNNIHLFGPKTAVICLPCQVESVKKIFTKNNKQCITICLTCSNQLSKEATYDFLSNNNINIKDVVDLKYRGKGWPSGLNIKLRNGKEFFFHNNQSDWPKYFHSGIYTLDKCFRCPSIIPNGADILLSDPWINKYIKNDKTGNTVVLISDDKIEFIVNKMIEKKMIEIEEYISKKTYIESQINSILKKIILKKHKLYFLYSKIYKTKLFKYIYISNINLIFKINNKLLYLLIKVI